MLRTPSSQVTRRRFRGSSSPNCTHLLDAVMINLRSIHALEKASIYLLGGVLVGLLFVGNLRISIAGVVNWSSDQIDKST